MIPNYRENNLVKEVTLVSRVTWNQFGFSTRIIDGTSETCKEEWTDRGQETGVKRRIYLPKLAA